MIVKNKIGMIGLMEQELADGGINIKKIYNMWKIYLVMFVIAGIISYLWVRGIDKMEQEHPDYQGHDLFNEEDNEKDNIHK
jgi:hypothetical protein